MVNNHLEVMLCTCVYADPPPATAAEVDQGTVIHHSTQVSPPQWRPVINHCHVDITIVRSKYHLRVG